jgi:Cu-Zn family superoxide dismutase
MNSIVRRPTIIGSLGIAAIAAATLWAMDARGARNSALVRMRDPSGQSVGTVHMHKSGDRVFVRARVHGLMPGFHGFHVHETGKCEGGTGFTTAGDHHNPSGDTHGAHAGDLPVLFVMDNGRAIAGFATDSFRMGELFDADGSAVIIHVGRDNYANIPSRYHSHAENTMGPDSETLATGDAGDRVACGVVGRSRK